MDYKQPIKLFFNFFNSMKFNFIYDLNSINNIL